MARETFASINASLMWHAKIEAIPEADRLGVIGWYTAVMAYCELNRTDGYIAYPRLAAVGPFSEKDRKKYTALAIGVRLFDEVDGGIEVHNYLVHCKSKDKIEGLSIKRAEAGSIGGKASAAKQKSSKRLKQVLGNDDAKQVLAANAEREESDEEEEAVVAEGDGALFDDGASKFTSPYADDGAPIPAPISIESGPDPVLGDEIEW